MHHASTICTDQIQYSTVSRSFRNLRLLYEIVDDYDIDMRRGLVDADARPIESACRITASRHVSTNRMISKKRGPFACHPSLRLLIFRHLMADFVPCCPASEQQLGVSCSFFLSWSSFDRSRQYCRVDCTSAHATASGIKVFNGLTVLHQATAVPSHR